MCSRILAPLTACSVMALPLLKSDGARLVQDLFRNADLADIMQEAAGLHRIEELRVMPEPFGDRHGVLGHALGMAGGPGGLGVQRPQQRTGNTDKEVLKS